jgi:hypothetical protein
VQQPTGKKRKRKSRDAKKAGKGEASQAVKRGG